MITRQTFPKYFILLITMMSCKESYTEAFIKCFQIRKCFIRSETLLCSTIVWESFGMEADIQILENETWISDIEIENAFMRIFPKKQVLLTGVDDSYFLFNLKYFYYNSRILLSFLLFFFFSCIITIIIIIVYFLHHKRNCG